MKDTWRLDYDEFRAEQASSRFTFRKGYVMISFWGGIADSGRAYIQIKMIPNEK